ncbi:MAG: DUF2892 domain-containing protein [Candidatus Saganbacteria bacterium]|nr:DUF2892 domain-containing protein [Candidatus Saganbacteria bacterium]
MEENIVGTTERILRVILGLLFVYVALYASIGPALVWTLTILGLAFIVTAISGFCPIYKLIGKGKCGCGCKKSC